MAAFYVQVLQARIDRFALKSEHAKNALMDPAKRLASNEALKPFDSQREFPPSQRPLGGYAAGAETFQIAGGGVFRPVDDTQVLATAAFHRWLGEAATALGNEIKRLYDHTLATALR